MNIPEDWTFKNSEIAENFDRHVREQLPWYDMLTDLISVIAKTYVPENGRIYDIGASTGNTARVLSPVISSRNIEYVCIDNSEQMGQIFNAPARLEICDALEYQYERFDVGILFLVLMFLPVSKRLSFFESLYKKLNVGGALIVVDKIESQGGVVSQAVYRSLLETKVKNGASFEAVLKKEFSLSGIQRPLSRTFFEEYNPYLIFRFGDFNAWVIEKTEKPVFSHRND